MPIVTDKFLLHQQCPNLQLLLCISELSDSIENLSCSYFIAHSFFLPRVNWFILNVNMHPSNNSIIGIIRFPECSALSSVSLGTWELSQRIKVKLNINCIWKKKLFSRCWILHISRELAGNFNAKIHTLYKTCCITTKTLDIVIQPFLGFDLIKILTSNLLVMNSMG